MIPVLDRLLISSTGDHANNHPIRIATDGEFEEWWEAVKVKSNEYVFRSKLVFLNFLHSNHHVRLSKLM